MAGLRTGAKGSSVHAEINVTPLVDVVLVLLIIFMVVTPLLTRGPDVRLPSAVHATSGPSTAAGLVLTVDAHRQLWLEREPVTLASLSAKLRERVQSQPHVPVQIKSDAEVSMRTLRPVLTLLRSERVGDVSFVVLEPRRGAP